MAMGTHAIKMFQGLAHIRRASKKACSVSACLTVSEIVKMNYGKRLNLGRAAISIYAYKKWKASGGS